MKQIFMRQLRVIGWGLPFGVVYAIWQPARLGFFALLTAGWLFAELMEYRRKASPCDG